MLMPTATRVLVCHAEPLVRRGIAATLGVDSRFDVVEQRPGDLGLYGYESPPFQVVITDLSFGIATAMQGRDGRLRRNGPTPEVLVLSHSDGELSIRSALECGVKGYLTQACQPEHLVDAVLALARGQRYLEGRVVQRLADTVAQDLPTPREIDVLRLMATGLCNKAIAAELNIAAGTVKTHVKSLLGKLDAPTRTAAADIANRRGLLDAWVENLAPPRHRRRWAMA
ncbi:two-component system, NarL family, nitrate/nitrite response regulator NarP [Roseateles sp. YR242]|uniref:LuxR C-terminal-related transcriptional regulator n=1 Tax=Roseateles sp. YR242 TaxID=1855305 RepID=UPI0008D82096|nr:response regulator transcription factor [Roseateles sp. YR242]SEL81891.1 two-component system, NarL family, nitrate/nitrite response regulator NarP [Roseateles sp. YR242]